MRPTRSATRRVGWFDENLECERIKFDERPAIPGDCPWSRRISRAPGRPAWQHSSMARRDATADLLAQVPLFSACSKKELQQLAKLAQDIHVDAGHVVVREGAA